MICAVLLQNLWPYVKIRCVHKCPHRMYPHDWHQSGFTFAGSVNHLFDPRNLIPFEKISVKPFGISYLL